MAGLKKFAWYIPLILDNIYHYQIISLWVRNLPRYLVGDWVWGSLKHKIIELEQVPYTATILAEQLLVCLSMLWTISPHDSHLRDKSGKFQVGLPDLIEAARM